jgi:SAM-dependent methyltransferase
MKPTRVYEKMATYYDLLYRQLVDYDGDCDFLEEIFRKHSAKRVKSILDIGSGTGSHAIILARRGYHVVGIDRSSQMLALAKKKKIDPSSTPEFRSMDMRNIKLREKFDAAVVMFGGFGYLIENEDVDRFLNSVGKSIPNGLLVFEFWQNSAIFPAGASALGHRDWDREEDEQNHLLVIRLNTSKYDAQTNLLSVNFDFYVVDANSKLLVDNFSETHVVRTYSISEVRHQVEKNGYNPIAFYVGDLKARRIAPAQLSTFRVICVAKKRGKSK